MADKYVVNQQTNLSHGGSVLITIEALRPAVACLWRTNGFHLQKTAS